VRTTCTAGLDPALAKSPQRTAWDTLQEYHGKTL